MDLIYYIECIEIPRVTSMGLKEVAVDDLIPNTAKIVTTNINIV